MKKKQREKDFSIRGYDGEKNLIHLKIFMNTRHLKNRGDMINV